MAGNTNEPTAEELAAAATAAAAEAAKGAEALKVAEAAAEKEMEAAAAAAKKAAGSTGQADSEMIAKLVQEKVDISLAQMKKSVDLAYKLRDEASAKVAAFEAKEREDTLKRLNEEGKHKEAYELQLAEERAANAALAKRNTELSRDVNVREALRGFTFRNEKAADMAFKEITSNLIQNETKQWIHRSGISVKEYCEVFAKDEDQSFLFKPKVNTGGGSNAGNSGNGTPLSTKPKSLFDLPQEEVIKMAAEGKFGAPPI